MGSPKTAITPTRAENFPEWYQQVIVKSNMAEQSSVRGCMVIKPGGFAIWEQIQSVLDRRFKETEHQNVYFPLLIPLAYLEREAQHVDGFAKECALVTHTKLVQEEGKLVPSGELEEPYVIRPTSETIFGESMAKWIQSYRDLPLKLNQWANVMRWEMRTRLFLRTSEFLWQEGHTAHATADDAIAEVLQMLGIYQELVQDYLAVPVLVGKKTIDERFPGAEDTYTLEGLMQDNKAVQMGTSHFLGQNFAKASNIVYLDKDSTEKHAWTTSWGVSTRLIGALIMSHSDDDGLVLPPKIASRQVVIIPITPKPESEAAVLAYCEQLQTRIKTAQYAGEPVRCVIDKRDDRWGVKKWDAVKSGVPLIIEVGPKDLEGERLLAIQRDIFSADKAEISLDALEHEIVTLLAAMQNRLFENAQKRIEDNSAEVETLEQFRAHFAAGKGFAYTPWCETAIDHDILSELKVTPRVQIREANGERCAFTGEPATAIVAFAKAY